MKPLGTRNYYDKALNTLYIEVGDLFLQQFEGRFEFSFQLEVLDNWKFMGSL
jgi:hypothetical protein